jgi:5'-deoxynucleotidase YfbR-like HD superfamily hydrolase
MLNNASHNMPLEELLAKQPWVDTIRSGGAVKRYHTVPTVGEQTVAAHSWGVAVLLIRILPGCSKQLLIAALFHDVAEKWTGDIPADAKWREPEVSTLLKRVERDVERALDIDIMLTDEERIILSACDRLELLWFCVEQARIGNQNMYVVYNRVIDWFNEHFAAATPAMMRFRPYLHEVDRALMEACRPSTYISEVRG